MPPEFEFAARMTEALSWPVFALVIVLILRRPISRMLLNRPPKKVKAGPFEVEWDRVISETETELPPSTPANASQSVRQELANETIKAPAIAVLEAHATVERALREILSGAGTPDSEISRNGAVQLARRAMKRELIGPDAVRAIEGISVLRNLAAHGSAREITPQQAMEYLTLVDSILFVLRHPS